MCIKHTFLEVRLPGLVPKSVRIQLHLEPFVATFPFWQISEVKSGTVVKYLTYGPASELSRAMQGPWSALLICHGVTEMQGTEDCKHIWGVAIVKDRKGGCDIMWRPKVLGVGIYMILLVVVWLCWHPRQYDVKIATCHQPGVLKCQQISHTHHWRKGKLDCGKAKEVLLGVRGSGHDHVLLNNGWKNWQWEQKPKQQTLLEGKRLCVTGVEGLGLWQRFCFLFGGPCKAGEN